MCKIITSGRTLSVPLHDNTPMSEPQPRPGQQELPEPSFRPPVAAPLSSSHALAALQLLTDAAATRTEELQPHSTFLDDEDDDDRENHCPVYNLFFEQGGAEDILTAMNFSARGFLQIWDNISGFVAKNWGVGRGRRSKFLPKYFLFMTLAIMKQWKLGTDWVRCSTLKAQHLIGLSPIL